MPQDCPRLRSACENCHKRKIRCQLSPNQAACQNCARNGTACLFAPRVKTGRPRLKKAISPAQTPTPPEFDEDEIISDSELESQDDANTTISAVNSQLPTPSEDHTSEEPWLLEEDPDLSDLNSFQHIFHAGASELHLTPSNEPQSVTSGSSRAESHFSSQFGLPTPSSASTTPGEIDPADLNNFEVDFNAALRLCAQLEQHAKTLQDAPQEPINIEAILGDIDSVCRTVMQPVSDHLAMANDASSALVVAALYKVFEICEAFIRSIFVVGAPGQEIHTQSAEHLLLLKRLDLVLLRAKIFLTRMGQHNAATKASRISFWIESLVKQQYQHWMW